MSSLVRLNPFSFAASSKLLSVPQPKNKPLFFFKNQPTTIDYVLKNKYGRPVAPISSSAQAHDGLVSHHHNDATSSLERGESNVPKHVAISLDGNRRWLKMRGLELDYTPFFEAQMKFADYCLKWGIGTATSYIYGIGNFEKRTKGATDLVIGQFERFLENGLENFRRKGVKVSIVGEKWMLPKSCQETINQVEEATRNNTNLDLVLLMCYSSQRDIVEATKKISKKVEEGALKAEDVNEDLVDQHLSIGGSRPPFDLFIRTGGQIRFGSISSWNIAHTEIYVTDTHAPEFGEDIFLDALHSFKHRLRMFAK